MAIYDKGQSTIDIYNLPSTITPVITPSPSWYYNVDGPTYNYDHWRISFDTPNVATTYTISAIGYVSQEVIAGSSDLHTNITLVAETRYMSKFSDGTNTYTVKDSEARTSLSGKQDTLVSGTNIKTINNMSILGSGNITIETSSTPDVDSETISYNSDNELQTIAVKNKRDNSTLPIWNGTEQQWNQGESLIWYYWQTSETAMWTNGGSLPSSGNWTSVTYGDGKFVAVTASNRATYSTDGINWTATTLPRSTIWYSVTYGNDKFVAISASDKAAYSTDGINWTASTMSSNVWESVTYGDGKFVAVAMNTNAAAYSTDGINWTASTMPSSSNWWSVTYGDGKFVAVGNDRFGVGSKITAYSTDGINWTASTMPSSGNWYSVTYGNGKFVAVVYDSNKSAYSTDGINWTATTLPSSASWQSVTYGNGKFVAVANGSDKSAYSTDGINWIETTMPSSANWRAMTYGDGKFIAVIYDSVVTAIFTIAYDKCYTLDQIPTTSSQVYSAPETTSSKTITSVDSGTITLSDTLTYNYTSSGNQNTYRTIGDAHPDWLSNIDNVGVKIGNTIVATAGGGGSNYTAGTGIDITNDEISVTSDISTGAALGATAVQPSALATVATSGNYNDLSNKPTIPTVNNATLTIQKNGTNVATFTANASSNVTANISVPTNTNELTNGAGFITSSALSGYQTTTNLVTSVSSSSTDTQYPSAKCVYDIVGDIESTLDAIIAQGS